MVLRLLLSEYRGAAHALPAGYRFRGPELTLPDRETERRLLAASFRNWQDPYLRRLRGWREDSAIYLLSETTLVGGVYVCARNEFDDDDRWGQVHYAFLDPSHRGRGLYSAMFEETVRRARRWGLVGVVLNSDRTSLPEIYIRWGAAPWRTIPKARLGWRELWRGLPLLGRRT